MRCIVLGDNHNSSVTFDRIPKVDAIYLHLGDLCFEDPDSARRSIDSIRELGAHCVLGSHDRPVIDDSALEHLKVLAHKMRKSGNAAAAELFRSFFDAARRLRDALEAEYLDFIRSLPETLELDIDGRRVIAVHDSLVDIGNRRILTVERAEANFAAHGFDILFHGHTHTPSLYELPVRGGVIKEKFFKLDDSISQMPARSRFILNPGSLSMTRGYPNTNPDSMLVRHGTPSGVFGVVMYEYGSYGVMDTEAETFEVVFFET